MHRNTDCSRRAAIAATRANVIVSRQYRQSGWSRFIRPAYAHQQSSVCIQLLTSRLDHRDVRETAQRGEAPTMEGNTPPPRPQPGEGYAAMPSARSCASAPGSQSYRGVATDQAEQATAARVGRADPGPLMPSPYSIVLGLRETPLGLGTGPAGFPSGGTRTRRCAENTEDGRGARTQQHFPYEPLVMGGRLVMPAELQRVHRAVLDGVADYRGDARCGGEALARIGGQTTPQANGIGWTMAS